MDDVVEHDAASVWSLVGLIFEDLDAAPQQALVGVARRGDGRVIVGLGGGDDPRPALVRRPAPIRRSIAQVGAK